MPPIKAGLPDVRVELAPASDSTTALADIAWRDVTPFLRLQDSLACRRGRSDERSQVSAGDLSLVLNNDGGQFTPGSTGLDGVNPIGLGCPVRVVLRPGYSTPGVSAPGNFFPAATSSGASGWFGRYGASLSYVTELVATLPTATAGVLPGANGVVSGLTIGRVYTFSASVYTVGSCPKVRAGIDYVGSGSSNTTANTWQRISFTFTASANQHFVHVAAPLASTAGDVFKAKNFQVDEGASVVTFADGNPLVPIWSGVVDDLSPMMQNGTRPVVAVRGVDRWAGLADFTLKSWETSHHQRTTATCVPAAYLWTLMDTEQVPAVADVASGRAIQLTVNSFASPLPIAADFGSGALPVDDGTVLALTPNAGNGYYLSGTVLPDAAPVSVDGASVLVNTTVAAASGLLQINGVNGNSATIEITATGKAKLTNFDPVNGAHSVTGTTTVSDGSWHQVGYQGCTLYVDGASEGVSFGTTAPVGAWFAVAVGGNLFGALYSGQLSHVALFPQGAPAGCQTSAYEAITGAVGETSRQRFTRLASLFSGCPIGSAGTGGLTTSMGKQQLAGKTPTSVFAELEAAEQGVVFVDTTGGVCLAGRDARYLSTPMLTPGPADVSADTSFTYNRAFVVNDVTATRPGGTEIRATNDESLRKYGVHTESLTVPVPADDFVTQIAQFRANIAAEPVTRVNELALDVWVKQNTIALTATARLEVGARITSAALPFPLQNFDVFTEGVADVFDTRRGWIRTVVTSPVRAIQVWQLDDGTGTYPAALGTQTVLAL